MKKKELKRPHFSKEQLAYLKAITTPFCCHVSGTHDPVHYEEKKYVCGLQASGALNNARRLLRLSRLTANDPTPKADCFWCDPKRPR